MTETMSNAATSTLSVNGIQWEHQPMEQEKLTAGLIRCTVGHANELVLTPETDLAASVLAMFLSGEHRFVGTLKHVSSGESGAYGRGLKELRIIVASRPTLADGDDPYYTGMSISAEEAKACRSLVDKLREAAHRRTKKSKRRKAAV